MLISQEAQGRSPGRQGGPRVSLTELRRQLSAPTANQSVHRQGLLELAGRLARVQALGDEYARVALSPFVVAAMERSGPDV